MCKGFISSCSVEVQVAFRIQNYIHSAFQQVLLPLFSSPAAPSAARAGLDSAAASADTMITGTLEQGCVQVFQGGSHAPPERTQQRVPQGNA